MGGFVWDVVLLGTTTRRQEKTFSVRVIDEYQSAYVICKKHSAFHSNEYIT